MKTKSVNTGEQCWAPMKCSLKIVGVFFHLNPIIAPCSYDMMPLMTRPRPKEPSNVHRLVIQYCWKPTEAKSRSPDSECCALPTRDSHRASSPIVQPGNVMKTFSMLL